MKGQPAIRRLTKLAFAVALAGCVPGALSQATASFGDSSSGASLSSTASYSGSANFSSSAAFNGSLNSGASGGTSPGSSASKRQGVQSRANLPNVMTSSQRKLAETYGIAPSALQIRPSSSTSQIRNPSAPIRVGVPRTKGSQGLGISSLSKSHSSGLSLSSSQPSVSSSNPQMSLMNRYRRTSTLGTNRSMKSQKSNPSQSTRSQELKSLMGMSGQP